MPALKNYRQEKFCQLIKQGIPPWRAYSQAGYRHNEANPYRLNGNERVQRRIAEITKSLAMKTKVTIESLTADLNRIRDGAERAEQFGAARSAVETLGKLHGHLIERKETGQPGDFSALQSAEEIVQRVRDELGDRAAEVLQALVSADDQADKPAN